MPRHYSAWPTQHVYTEMRDALEAMTKRVVAKLLHTPTVTLKAAAGTARGEGLAEAFQDLFGLEP